jgi:hypothetical protein
MTTADENTKKLLCYLDDVCITEIDNLEILRFFKLLLSAHWETSSNHNKYEPSLACYNFDNNSGFFVETNLDADPKSSKEAPGIKIKLGRTEFQKGNLGDVIGESDSGDQVYKGWLSKTTIIFSHCFDQPAVAHAAAASSFEFLTAISGELKSVMGITHFQPLGIETIKKEKSGGTDNFSVDLVFDLSYNYYVSTHLETHRIKVIAANISTQ